MNVCWARGTPYLMNDRDTRFGLTNNSTKPRRNKMLFTRRFQQLWIHHKNGRQRLVWFNEARLAAVIIEWECNITVRLIRFWMRSTGRLLWKACRSEWGVWSGHGWNDRNRVYASGPTKPAAPLPVRVECVVRTRRFFVLVFSNCIPHYFTDLLLFTNHMFVWRRCN